MNRRAIFTAALAVSMMMGCSSPAETDSTTHENTSTTASALSSRRGGNGNHDDGNHDDGEHDDGEGSSSRTFTLTSLSGTTLSGVNSLGQTFTASFTSTTIFLSANLNRFIPSVPIRPSLVAYNAAVQSHQNVLGAIEDLVSFGGHARVVVINGTIRAFQPVP